LPSQQESIPQASTWSVYFFLQKGRATRSDKSRDRRANLPETGLIGTYLAVKSKKSAEKPGFSIALAVKKIKNWGNKSGTVSVKLDYNCETF
jgi:hypothetical protein